MQQLESPADQLQQPIEIHPPKPPKQTSKIVTVIAVIVAVFSFLIMLLMVLSSRTPPQVSTTTSPFTAKASVTTDRAVIEIDISQTKEGALTIGVSKPRVLRGLRLTYTGSDLSLRFLGMQANLNDDRIPSRLLTQALVAAVNANTEATGISMQARSGVTTITGQLPDGSFSLRVDRETGSQIKVSTPTLTLESSFGNFLFDYQKDVASKAQDAPLDDTPSQSTP